MQFNFKKAIASLLAVAVAAPSWAAVPISTYAWNAASELASVQTGSGATTQYGYNEHGELVQETWPAGFGGVSYGRNGQGALTSVQDPRGLVTSYLKDGFADVMQQTSPDTGTETYTRDSAGNLTAQALPTGGSIAFSYDAANRVTSTNSGDESATFGYDAGAFGKGRLTSMQDSSGSTTWAFDAQGSVTNKTQTAAGVPLSVAYGYSAGRLSQITYPSGTVVSFGFDAERVTSIEVNGVTAISGVEYQPFGPATSWQMGSAGTYSRTFDTAGRVSSYTYDNGARQLDWDAANRLTSVQNPDGSNWTYGCDALDRMVSANEGTQGTRAFGLDAVGNRTSLTIDGAAYSYGVDSGANRLLTAAGPSQAQSFQYDAAGRVTSDGTRFYTWTNAGRLATASAGATSAAYTYNGFGQRVRKATSTQARQYVYAEDGVSLLGEYAELNGAAAPIVEVVYLGGTPVLALSGGQVYYIQSDHLNTPRTIKNSAGAVVWRWESDAFGGGQANSNPGGLMLFEFNSRFPGQQFDAETGLYYNNARYYDPVVGRYISSDPIGLKGGINTFAYAELSPLSLSDPYGLWSATIGLFRGVGAQISFGQNPNGSGFASLQFGLGIGGGFIVNPLGRQPGYEDCQGPSWGVGTGVYGQTSFAAGPIGASAGGNFGRNITGKGSNLYGGLTQNGGLKDKLGGFSATLSGGGQVTIFGGGPAQAQALPRTQSAAAIPAPQPQQPWSQADFLYGRNR